MYAPSHMLLMNEMFDYYYYLFQTEKICALLAQLADASPESGFLSVHPVARFPHSDSIRLVNLTISFMQVMQ
jgi:hypothetical protein